MFTLAPYTDAFLTAVGGTTFVWLVGVWVSAFENFKQRKILENILEVVKDGKEGCDCSKGQA